MLYTLCISFIDICVSLNIAYIKVASHCSRNEPFAPPSKKHHARIHVSGFVVVLAAKASHFRFKFKEINDFISKIISY